MSQTVFIDGGAGTTGLEIADRLAGRDEFALLTLDEDRRKDDEARREALNEADFVILCLPDDAARDAVAMIETDKVRVIDASSAHRTARGWIYGFPEIEGHREVASARRVSNPGCYPTGFIGLIAPLVRAGMLPADWPYTCNAVSGYSGGGKAMIGEYTAKPQAAWRGYGLSLGHKHVPEMRQRCGLDHDPVFCPAVVPAYRGMAVEVPLSLGAMPGTASPEVLRASLSETYAGSEIVRVHEEVPDTLVVQADMPPSDRLDLYVCASADGAQVRLVAMLDNLGKGAGGAAVQNLNLMAGLSETAGLRL